jgi:hypothetical protein
MSMGAMLDMMQRMMGQQPGQGQQPGNAGDQGGEGKGGPSDAANKDLASAGEGNKETRRFEKSSGKAGAGLPPEFQKALDAYNKKR